LCDVVFKYALGNGSQGQHLLLSMQRATGFLYGAASIVNEGIAELY
jgi:hypothetical protein